MTRAKQKPDADILLWRAVADDLSRTVRALPGGTTRLTARLQKRCPGRVLFRQQVEAWLCADPERRVEPKAGMALLLVEEAAALTRKSK